MLYVQFNFKEKANVICNHTGSCTGIMSEGRRGLKTLYNADAEGIELKVMYGAFAEHVIYYVVEADSQDALHKFLLPGFKRCDCTITPVAEEAIVK